jgi:hypothetical protein
MYVKEPQRNIFKALAKTLKNKLDIKKTDYERDKIIAKKQKNS